MPALLLNRSVLAERPRATLALFPSLGTSHSVWDRVVRHLADSRLDVLLFDLPGHGSVPAAEGFTIASLADDAIEQLASARRTNAVIAAGVSMGGAIAVELARRAEVAGFVTFNSALRFGSAEGWDALIADIRRAGTASSDPDGTRDGWFTRPFAAGPGRDVVAGTLATLAAVDPDAYVACCHALAAYDGTTAPAEIRVPGLAVGGSADRATPASGMRALADANDGIAYVELAGAHLAIVEDAWAAAALLDELVAGVLANEEERAA